MSFPPVAHAHSPAACCPPRLPVTALFQLQDCRSSVRIHAWPPSLSRKPSRKQDPHPVFGSSSSRKGSKTGRRTRNHTRCRHTAQSRRRLCKTFFIHPTNRRMLNPNGHLPQQDDCSISVLRHKGAILGGLFGVAP